MITADCVMLHVNQTGHAHLTPGNEERCVYS